MPKQEASRAEAAVVPQWAALLAAFTNRMNTGRPEADHVSTHYLYEYVF